MQSSLRQKEGRRYFSSLKISGYNNVAEAWKEALEIPDVERKIEELYAELLPFYKLLHGYVRSRMTRANHHPFSLSPCSHWEASELGTVAR